MTDRQERDDNHKTRADLLEELASLRQRVAELEVYSRFFEHLPRGASVWVLEDPDELGSFRFVACNPANTKHVGAPMGPYVGTTMAESFPAALETDLPAKYREVIRTGQSVDLPEVRYSDDKIPEGIFAVKAFHLGGRFVGILTEDIRALRQAEEQVDVSEQRYRGFFESAIDMIHFFDEQCRIVDVNETELRKLGYSRQELIGRHISEIIHPGHRLGTEGQMAKARSGHTVASYETGLLAKDGTTIFVVANMVPIMAGGKFQGAQAILHDITDRKRMEDELRRSNERFRLVLKAPIVLFAQDRDLRFTWVYNPAPEFDADALIGKTDAEVAPPDQAAAPMALKRQVLETGKAARREIAVSIAGKTSWHDLHVEPHRDASGEVIGVTCISIDITERKRVEQQVRDSRERLRRLTKRLHAVREEERGLMAREIHDQVGQALTSLKIDLSWLVNKLPKNQKAARGRASSMISVVETTLDSVHDLSSRLRPAILDDLGLEAAIEWQAQEFTSRTGCNSKLDLRAGELGLSHDRDTTVFRILQEALTNVACHAEASRVEISLQTPPGQLVLEVRDDGKGIPREKLASSQSLGLINMHERAATLGGEVGFLCPAEGGTVLSLRLPIAAERS